MVLRKVAFVTCIREVSGSNLGRDTDCADRIFCGSLVCQGHWYFNGKWPHALLWVVLLAARGKLTLSGTPVCLIYCDIFIFTGMYTIYKYCRGPHHTTNRAAGWRPMVKVNAKPSSSLIQTCISLYTTRH
jgi:hypothetical protein